MSSIEIRPRRVPPCMGNANAIAPRKRVVLPALRPIPRRKPCVLTHAACRLATLGRKPRNEHVSEASVQGHTSLADGPTMGFISLFLTIRSTSHSLGGGRVAVRRLLRFDVQL